MVAIDLLFKQRALFCSKPDFVMTTFHICTKFTDLKFININLRPVFVSFLPLLFPLSSRIKKSLEGFPLVLLGIVYFDKHSNFRGYTLKWIFACTSFRVF